MAKPCTPHLIPQAEQLFKPQTCNVGVEGDSPRLSLGDLKGYSLRKENTPFIARFRTVRKTPARDAGFVFA